MKNFGKYFLVIGIFLVSFLGSLQQVAKRNLNHIGHTVQNHDFRDFAGIARAWRNNYFTYKNSEEKEKLGKNSNGTYSEVSPRKEVEKEAGENNNEVVHEVKTEKPKTFEQICKEKCLVWLDPQERMGCMESCLKGSENTSFCIEKCWLKCQKDT